MKASVYHRQKTFETTEVHAAPPGPDEVQIKIAYCGICGTDYHIYLGHMDKRVADPQIIGHEMSGTITAVGSHVTGWQPGDQVVVRPLDPCGECPACKAGHSHICQNLKFLGIDTPGALQSYWTVPAHTLHRLPASISLKHAAMIEPVAVACHDVRMGRVKAGEQAVVIGGGPIGMLIALIARHAGAQVLIAEVAPFRLELARQLGFDVANPLVEDVAALVNQRTGGAGADIVFEVSGSNPGAAMMTEIARTRARVVMVAIYAEPAPVNLHRFFWRELQMIGARVYEPEDFEQAIQLVDQRVLPLDQLISTVEPLENLQSVFERIEAGANFMKAMITLQAD